MSCLLDLLAGDLFCDLLDLGDLEVLTDLLREVTLPLGVAECLLNVCAVALPIGVTERLLEDVAGAGGPPDTHQWWVSGGDSTPLRLS
jgi:hypothetical protein